MSGCFVGILEVQNAVFLLCAFVCHPCPGLVN